jgi:hypothetical protein
MEGELMSHALAIEDSDAVLFEPQPLENIGPLPPEDVFFGAPRSEAAFGGAAGILQGPAFTADELDRLRKLIKEQLVENARRLSPQAAADIESVELDRYHSVADRYEHAKLLSKLGRILSAKAVDEIKQMSFFDYVRRAFGPFYLSDEEVIGHEQICFRVVRPNRREDVGSLHRDTWFWDYYKFPVPEGKSRVKVWVPVCGEQERAGLLLAPESHKQPAPYYTQSVNGKLTFIPNFDVNQIGLQRFCGSPGDPIMFNHDTLHVGSLNRGEGCRVSFELTVMFDTESA